MNLFVGSSIVASGSNVSGVCIKLLGSAGKHVEIYRVNPYCVIRSSIDFGSKMNVGNVILLRSAPGRNCDIMDRRTASMRNCYPGFMRTLTILVPLFHGSLLFLLLHIFCWRLIATAYRKKLKVKSKNEHLLRPNGAGIDAPRNLSKLTS